MPNTFAYIIMIVWPAITYIFIRKYGVGAGSLLALLAAYMFLPASLSLNLPGFPDLDKFRVTILSIILFILIKKDKWGWNYLSLSLKFLFILYLIGPFFTSITNQEKYLYLPGLSLYDGLSSSVINFIEFFPFFIGLTFFREENEQIILFKYFAIATFAYAFFALYEIRMSPQLHQTIYGYFPHSWIQQYRSGGFRAVVFMGHGLLVAMFLALGVAFWSAIRQTNIKVYRYSNSLGFGIVFLTLFLSKSMAALLYALVAFIAIRYLKPKLVSFTSVVFAFIFISYPLTTAIGLFPHDSLVNIANDINSERAQSLEYRFDNENILLAHAEDKPLFGWGGWGRNRVYDPETWQDISVTDGAWIITLGVSGWLGFLSTYLFMFFPIWLVWSNRKKLQSIAKQQQVLLSSQCLVVSLLLIDQLPNASLNPLYLLIAGSLLGRTQVLMMNDSVNKQTTVQG